MKKAPQDAVLASPSVDYAVLNRITDRAFFMALRMIDIANARPEKEKAEPKVGGHPSACASSKHILAAIHLVLRKGDDFFANKPHVSPMDHALNYAMELFRDHERHEWMAADQRELAMHHLRHFSFKDEPVFQSYHAEADPDSWRFFPSGSVGIPPVNALYTALGYDYAKDHGYEIDEKPTFWCLMGDSEFREGSLHEAMPDAGERELGRLVWIVDYNRQNLDGTRVTNEKALGGSDADRIVKLAEANGWEAIKVEHGKKRLKLFKKAGGDELERVLEEEMSDFQLQALITANRPELTVEVLSQKSDKLKKWLKTQDAKEIHDALMNLGGHDLETLVEVFTKASREKTKPTLIVAYTIKGHGLKCQAMSGNHSAMPEEDELREIAKGLGVSYDEPFVNFASSTPEGKYLAGRKAELRKAIERIGGASESRLEKSRTDAKAIEWPTDFNITALKMSPLAHTQWMWGQIAAKLDRLARGDDKEAAKLGPTEQAWQKVAQYFVTMAPDVGSSTNTSPNMNGKLYGDIGQEDFEALYKTKDTKAPDVVPHANQRTGHLRFEIAEGNCMSAAGSIGKMRKFTGIPFYPAMTIYDFFIKRALDQYYYNVYWHSSFATIGTPSGITLAPEGAQHSWKSDIQMPNSITWEPCFAKELEWILADTLRRHFTGDDVDREAALIRCVTKGIHQKELLERLKQQKRFQSGDGALPDGEIMNVIREHTLKGGYALIDYRGFDDYVPGDNVVHLFAMGALVPEAWKASDKLREKGIYANVFVVTSPDLLLGNFAYHDNYSHLREGLGVTGDLHLHPERGQDLTTVADWYSVQGGRIPVLSVHDGEPGLLDNVGSIVGVKHKALAVRKTSKSGTTWDIFAYHHLDAESVAEAAIDVLKDTATERFRVSAAVASAIDLSGSHAVSHGNGGSYASGEEAEEQTL